MTASSPTPWKIDRAGDLTLVTDAARHRLLYVRDDHVLESGVVEHLLRCVNAHAALVDALHACSFRLGVLVAAHAEFDEANAKAPDAATAALTLAGAPYWGGAVAPQEPG